MGKSNEQTHVVSLRVATEDYGWLIRYCDKQDLTMSQVMRKALRMYRAAIAKKEEKAKEAKDGKEQ